jgi:acyl-CoA-binding protein
LTWDSRAVEKSPGTEPDDFSHLRQFVLFKGSLLGHRHSEQPALSEVELAYKYGVPNDVTKLRIILS